MTHWRKDLFAALAGNEERWGAERREPAFEEFEFSIWTAAPGAFCPARSLQVNSQAFHFSPEQPGSLSLELPARLPTLCSPPPPGWLWASLTALGGGGAGPAEWRRDSPEKLGGKPALSSALVGVRRELGGGGSRADVTAGRARLRRQRWEPLKAGRGGAPPGTLAPPLRARLPLPVVRPPGQGCLESHWSRAEPGNAPDPEPRSLGRRSRPTPAAASQVPGPFPVRASLLGAVPACTRRPLRGTLTRCGHWLVGGHAGGKDTAPEPETGKKEKWETLVAGAGRWSRPDPGFVLRVYMPSSFQQLFQPLCVMYVCSRRGMGQI
ncbi:uncharacterized protein LOC126087849 [Elephas maximus indicus]|uniref:uncharacterized protein LOC126087849 n=1 Tax=Elephas maximus indicus TaxID=99487 RepID=UPI002116036C|nr:uncharacterized protein LOC126087849 [Elephas maximus indicus]